MIKSELMQKLADKFTYLSEARLEEAVNLILLAMREQLINGNRVEIRGFGSFSRHYHKPRKAHNPKTGEKLTTKGKYSAHFKAGKTLKDLLNSK